MNVAGLIDGVIVVGVMETGSIFEERSSCQKGDYWSSCNEVEWDISCQGCLLIALTLDNHVVVVLSDRLQ